MEAVLSTFKILSCTKRLPNFQILHSNESLNPAQQNIYNEPQTNERHGQHSPPLDFSIIKNKIHKLKNNKSAVYKSGTGTRGRGHGDACVGTWDLGTRDKGLEGIKYGTRGLQTQGHRGRGDDSDYCKSRR